MTQRDDSRSERLDLPQEPAARAETARPVPGPAEQQPETDLETALLRGRTVLVAGGAPLGTVEEAYFDRHTLALRALRVRVGECHLALPVFGARPVGADAVAVPFAGRARDESLIEGNPYAGLLSLTAAKRMRVIDAAGNRVGTLVGLALDPRTGVLRHLTARPCGKGAGTAVVLRAADLRHVGADSLVVADAPRPSLGVPLADDRILPRATVAGTPITPPAPPREVVALLASAEEIVQRCWA